MARCYVLRWQLQLSARRCNPSWCVLENASIALVRRPVYACCIPQDAISTLACVGQRWNPRVPLHLACSSYFSRHYLLKKQFISSEFDKCTPQKDKSRIFEKENIWTVPNLLSMLRITSTPVLGWCVLQGHHVAAVSVFVLAGLTDWVDGYIARNVRGQMSTLGSVLDPLADKLLVCVLFLTLTKVGYLPVWLTCVVLGRDALLVLGGFYLRYTTLPPPKTWSRYWDIQRSTLTVTPSLVSKVNTLLQMMLLGLTLASPAFGFEHHPSLQVLWYITGATTLISGWSYLFSRNGFQLLKSKSTQK